MHPIKKLYCRIYQAAFHAALPLLPYREPKRFKTMELLEPELQELGFSSVLIITDPFLYKSGITSSLENVLNRNRISFHIYADTCANPTTDNVEEALRLYQEYNCQCLIALGGGSSMDCAKAVGARIAYPKRSLNQLKGTLRVLRKIPPLIAIPTTAGTGSEVTLAAVITDPNAHHKYTMNDFVLIPSYAVLDPELTFTLPPSLTATTGMDALTHAVEAYIGRSTSKETRHMALKAVSLIFRNIETAYQNGTDRKARAHMLHAAYFAGIAFSKSYVGYVHAVAHSLGGQYNTPHGLANSVLLPIVLETYGERIHKKLHRLAIVAGVSTKLDSHKEGADKFITAIRDLNKRMGIPETLPGIRKEDIPLMAKHADKEANPLYPVPVLMNRTELEQFYYKVADWREHDETR
ncbi:MAG: iron-containing alcohol dehydrogenase [Lachnospiraceae bacterium]|nr:iron-containing alcohol dehydrogenase [Lachnospiraceae bacterium]